MSQIELGEKLAEGVYFNQILDSRFKTDRISVNLMTPLQAGTVSQYAVLPFLLRKGYRDCPDFTKLNSRLNELYGAYLDADVRKVGDNQVLALSISSLDDQFALDGEQMVEELCQILCGIVFAPNLEGDAFPEKEFRLERQSLIDLIESEINEKRSFAIRRAQEILCQNEPFGLSKYGTLEQAKALTNQQVAVAYRHILETAHIEIIFVGCGDPAPAKKCFVQALSGISRHDIADIQSVPSRKAGEVKEVTDRYQVAQSKMVLGFKMDHALSQKELDAVRLMVALYGGTPVSKLFVHVREEMSLCYYCASRLDRMKEIVLVDCGVEQDNVEKAKAEILRQLDLIRQGEFTEEEIQNAKLSLVNSFRTIGDSASGIESWYLGQRSSQTQRSPEEEAQRLSGVTKEEIQKAAACLQLDTVYLLTGMDNKPA